MKRDGKSLSCLDQHKNWRLQKDKARNSFADRQNKGVMVIVIVSTIMPVWAATLARQNGTERAERWPPTDLFHLQ